MYIKYGICIIAAAVSVGLSPATVLADWPGFLGPGGNPVTAESSLPVDFEVGGEGEAIDLVKNVAWRIPLEGRSVSGPIVVGDLVLTTSTSAMEERWLHVAAVNKQSGELAWERSTKATGRPFCHPTSANAAPTPCSDGQFVYAFFSSNDLVCYDLEGNLQWFKSIVNEHPLAGNDIGMAASPVVVDGVVVVSVECQADSFVAGISAENGTTLWEVKRPADSNWASPRVAVAQDGSKAVLLSGNSFAGVDPQTGKELWALDIGSSTVATAASVDGQIFVPGKALQVYDFATASEAPELAWETSRLTPGSSSMLITPLGVIGLNRSILVCCNTESGQGERRWNARLKDAGQIWATPVVAGEYLYAFGMTGKCFTVKLSEDSAEVVAESELGSEVLGSPAIDDGALFVRSVDALWRISAK